MPHRDRVAALVVNEVVAFDLAIPAQVFGREPDLYDWVVCAPEPGLVPAETGFDVLVPHGLDMHRRVRPRGRRTARRPPRRHALALRRAARTRVPGGRGRR